MTMCWLSL